jgi:hypothetical protein
MRAVQWLGLFVAVLAVCASWLTLAAARDGQEEFVPARTTMSNNVVFRAGDKAAAIYRFGGDLAKPILWPLRAPNNKEITRDWPMRPAPSGSPKEDHPHQKSAWFTYGDVIPEGMTIQHKRKGVEGIDFWAEGPGCGRIVCVRTGDYHNEANRAALTTYNEWRTPDGEKILDEVRRIQFFNYEKARLFVVDIDLCASVVPITFGDTKEGAFGVRVAHSLREDRGKGRITNAEGSRGEKECWGRISAWCDYSGPVEGETVGIALFAAPDNPYPSCWHSRAYGLMAANPFGRDKSGFPAMKGKKDKKDLVHLAKGEHLKLRYGIFVHSGDVKEGKVAEGYELFKKIK